MCINHTSRNYQEKKQRFYKCLIASEVHPKHLPFFAYHFPQFTGRWKVRRTLPPTLPVSNKFCLVKNAQRWETNCVTNMLVVLCCGFADLWFMCKINYYNPTNIIQHPSLLLLLQLLCFFSVCIVCDCSGESVVVVVVVSIISIVLFFFAIVFSAVVVVVFLYSLVSSCVGVSPSGFWLFCIATHRYRLYC